MKRTRYLGDWARLGIIASLLWMLGSAYHFSGANQKAYWQATSRDCLALQKEPPPAFNLWSCGVYNRAQGDEARKHAWDGVAQRSLGPVLVGWLVVYLCALFRR
jgi:hypothetical protein